MTRCMGRCVGKCVGKCMGKCVGRCVGRCVGKCVSLVHCMYGMVRLGLGGPPAARLDAAQQHVIVRVEHATNLYVERLQGVMTR